MMERTLLYDAARRDFMTFAQLAFGIANPAVQFEPNWHLDAIATKLNEAAVSRSCREIVTMPPRSLKSFMISVAFTAYLLGKDPTLKIIVVTYGEKLSEQLSSDTARIMGSDFYKKVFPATRITGNTKLKLTTSQGGSRFATSVNGPATGFGGDWIIVDDPMNANEVNSLVVRESVKTYFDEVLSSRVNDETAAHRLVVMQRLHEDDLVGHLLAKGGWNELKLQAKATKTVEIDVGRLDFHIFKTGDLLHEKRLPQSVLDQKLFDMGSIPFQAQYQQDPTPAKGNIVKREWLKFYNLPIDTTVGEIVLSLDTATKTNPASDYSVCTVWLCRSRSYYLIDVMREKVDYSALEATMIMLCAKYEPSAILIEDAGIASALILRLREMGLVITECKPLLDKATRFYPATSFIEAGQMLLPIDAPFTADFVSELLGFPNAKHDDQVDSISQFFAWIRARGYRGIDAYGLNGFPKFDPVEEDATPQSLWDVLGSLPRY